MVFCVPIGKRRSRRQSFSVSVVLLVNLLLDVALAEGQLLFEPLLLDGAAVAEVLHDPVVFDEPATCRKIVIGFRVVRGRARPGDTQSHLNSVLDTYH